MHPEQKQLYYSSLQSRHDGANEDNLANAQSRRANVTIVNIPEKSEGDDVFGYIIPGFRKKLWEKNLEYSSTYPTKLWLWHEVFPPSEVEPFLSSVEEAYSKPLLHMMM